jgi:hypothetical protein
MFGLTKREQRWKAEQQAAEVLVGLVGTLAQAASQVSVAEAQTDAAELARLRGEAASFHMAYRMRCDEETKAQAVEIERLRGLLHELALAADAVDGDGPAFERLDAAMQAAMVALGA